MAISFISSASGTNTATMPTHQAGDFIIVFAFNESSSTAVTIPGGWTDARDFPSSNDTELISYTLAYKIAASSSETVGTWTNATGLIVGVYRGAVSINAKTAFSGNFANVAYQSLSLLSPPSWVISFSGHESTDTSLETPPLGTTLRTNYVDSFNELSHFDSNGPVSSWSSNNDNVSVGGTQAAYFTYVGELTPLITYITPQFIGSATGTNTATMPTHQAGDLILVHTFRDGNTTTPSLASGYTNIISPTGTNTCSNRSAYKIAASSSETVGTWTNATSTIVEVWRGVDTTTPIGASASTGGASTIITYPALTLTRTDGSVAVSSFGGHRSVDVAIQTVPSGMTLTNTVSDATDEAASFRIISPTSFTSRTASVGGTSSGWRSVSIEILGKVDNPGSLTKTLDDITVVASNVSGISGVSSITTDGISVSTTSNLSIRGVVSNTLSAISTSSTSRINVNAASSNILSSVTTNSSSRLSIAANSSNNISSVSISSDIKRIFPISSSITIGNILASSTSRIAISGQSGLNIDAITSSGESIISTKGVSSCNIDDINTNSSGFLFVNSVTNISIDNITTSSSSLLSIRASADTSASISISSQSAITISGGANNSISIITDFSGKLLILSGASNLIEAISSVSNGYRNPYVYSDTSGNNPNFETSGGSSDWPYGFSTFTPSDDPYRS